MSRQDAASCPRSEAAHPIPGGIAPRHSFTLIELMLVVGILILMFSLLTSTIGPRTIHGAQVEAAANQLASVLRKTRQLAMEHRAMYGVTFNIQNAPGIHRGSAEQQIGEGTGTGLSVRTTPGARATPCLCSSTARTGSRARTSLEAGMSSLAGG